MYIYNNPAAAARETHVLKCVALDGDALLYCYRRFSRTVECVSDKRHHGALMALIFNCVRIDDSKREYLP
jgi:hypothetical protein